MDPLIDDPFGGDDRSATDGAGCSRGIADFPGENVVVMLARPVRTAGLALQVVAQNRRSRRHRLVGVDERRQIFIFDLDQIDRVGGDIAVLDDERDLLALKQHLLVGQDGLNIAGEGRHPMQFQRL